MPLCPRGALLTALALALWSCTGEDPDIAGGGTTPAADGGPNGGPNGGDGSTTAERKLAIAEPPALIVVHGMNAKVKVTVTRTAFTGDVIVQAPSLPTGVTIAPITIPDGSNEGELTVATVNDAAQVVAKVKLDATSSGGAEKASALLALTVRGRPGELDTTFNGGEVPAGSTPPTGFATGANGELYVVSGGGLGTCVIRRFTRDGQLDATFATGGVATITLALLSCRALAVQDDGKMVVAGFIQQAQGTATVGRFFPTGAPDTSFAPDGFVTVAGVNALSGVAIDASKRIVVFGRAGGDADVRRLAAADGTVDPTHAPTTLAGTAPGAFALAADGSTRVAGTAASVMELARIDPDGNASLPKAQRVALDSPLGTPDSARVIAVDPSGAAYVGGLVESNRAVVARVQDDAHDTTWGTSGWFDVPLVGSTTPGAILVEPSGHLLVIGTLGASTSVVLVRVKADGKIETAFADNGIESSKIEALSIAGATLQGEQVVVVLAKANNTASLVRYWR